jgi:Putative zinc-finger
MSLFIHKRAIERAVLGELAPRDEARLRAHLAACARCRGHYDGLARTIEALGSGRAETARARERLFAALGTTSTATPAARASMFRSWRLSMALVPAAIVAVLWITRAPDRPSRPDADEVTLRGSAAAATASPPATVVLYASRKTDKTSSGGGAGKPDRLPVRLVGELPGSGEARLSMNDYLQLGLRGLRAPTHVRVAGVDERGRIHDYVGDTAVVPGAGPLTLGGSVELTREHEPGRLRLLALFSERAIDDEAVRAALARLSAPRGDRGPTGDAGMSVVTGLVVIER